jgi:V8-like Glu-specific endopeptidase
LRIFYSYSHKDEKLRQELGAHLSTLQYEGLTIEWHDRMISAGQEWGPAIDENLEAADIILLLLSAPFLYSEFIMTKELPVAMTMNDLNRARVVPIIVRPVDWQHTPVQKLQVLPKDGKPVVRWASRDEAWVNVVAGVRAAIQDLVRHTGDAATVGLADANKPAPKLVEVTTGLGKVFGPERFTSIRWFRDGLERCRAVARVEDDEEDGIGTGFLVDGRTLHPTLPPVVMLTAAHVMPEGISPKDTILNFRGLEDADGQGVRVRRVLWSSPPAALDATILELEQLPDGVSVCPLAPRMPLLEAHPLERVYVIGHPLGRLDVQLSIADNHLLDYDDTKVHYRAPTEPGSAGSPVFNRRWAVIALHHSGSFDMPRLHGSGTYSANEGIRVDQIKAALERDR